MERRGVFGASFLDLSPDEFDVAGGLEKLLAVLRASPLQTLPIPDSFSKLERWHV